MHQNIGPAYLYVMRRRNRKHLSKVRTMAESRKNKLAIPNSHTMYSSVPIPYLLLPTRFDNFCFFTEKQIKATMTKIAQRNRQLTEDLECFGKTLPISASSHISMSRPEGFFCCGATLKQRIYAWKLRACHLLKVWLSGIRSLRTRHPKQSLIFQVNHNSLTTTQKAAGKQHCCPWNITALVLLYNISFYKQPKTVWASSKILVAS